MRINIHRRCFLTQRKPLLHAKAVLFVNNNKSELRVAHLALKKRVRADKDLAETGGYSLELFGTWFALLLTAVPADLYTERLEPLPKINRMLFGQNLGRRHQRNLIARVDSTQCRQRRNNGFSRTYVALQEAQHRRVPREVFAYFSESALLPAG